jgi:hypothetical protein
MKMPVTGHSPASPGSAESMREESGPRQIAGTLGSDLGRRPPGPPFADMMSLFSSVAPYMPYVGSKQV